MMTLLLIALAIGPRVDAHLSARETATFLVFPLENKTQAPSLDWVGEALALSISDSLVMPGVDAIGRDERIRIVEAADLPPGAVLSRASMIRVAQEAEVDKIVFGAYSRTASELRISLQVLDVTTLHLGGEIVANGSLAMLRHLENELAWIILSSTGLNRIFSREAFRGRSRTIPNAELSEYIRGMSLADSSEQLAILQKTVARYPGFAVAQYEVGKHHYGEGDCSTAIPHLTRAAAGRQHRLASLFMLGTCRLQQNEPAEAARAYLLILEERRDAAVLNNLGVALLRRGDAPSALRHLKEARGLMRDDATLALNLAAAHWAGGDPGSARAMLLDYSGNGPGQGMLRLLLSAVLESAGDREGAAKAASQARRMGVEADGGKAGDPLSWTRLFPEWKPR